MKFTGLVVSFLVAYAQAELPYNLRDTSGSNAQELAEPRHFSKTYDGQHHGATGTGGFPHHSRPRPTGTGRHHRPSSSAPPHGAYPTNFEGPLPGHGGIAESDNGDGKAWGPNPGQFPPPPGAWPPVGKGKGHGHGTGLSLPPWPLPTGGFPHPPGGSAQPPKWPKSTLSTRTMSRSHSQSGVAKPTGPVKPYEQGDE
ncbi:hypothetical protein PG991_003830 [Apiospora marii]|uniref:Uncharacterized protein n=1 Tax=Apiospora marii TaxID=335849 RepID=A0ABR1S6A8_9PEZI